MSKPGLSRRRRCGAGLALLIGVSLPLAGCPSTPAPQAPRWQRVLGSLPGGLLSVSGTSQTDVLAVGADPGDGGGPLVLHYDGATWRRLSSGAAGDLWWISDRAVAGDFYLSGDGGLILRYDPESGSFSQFSTPGDQTIFGIWGDSANNLFACGGDVSEPDTSGVIWRFDGAVWTAEDLSGLDPDGLPVAFKVWGRSGDEVYVCGERGLLLRFDGQNWTRGSAPTTRTLFTIHGNQALIAAVGGAQSGVIVERPEALFHDATPDGLLQMNGVFVPAQGMPVAVGREGAVAFRSGGEWRAQDTGLGLSLLLDYHATWVDPDGGVWAVGGNIAGEPRSDGLVVYYGTQDVATALE